MGIEKRPSCEDIELGKRMYQGTVWITIMIGLFWLMVGICYYLGNN